MVGSEFDVFLSFRGEDTRKTFTDHLYEGLQLRCVNTFRDSESLKRGENIDKLLEYIENSKICIPIFSKGYADSKWCLRELTKIVECNKKVIPVFFEVDPSDVKSKSSEFASGFKKHESEGKVKQEEVIKWREALTKVGNISGFTLKYTNGMEGKLVQIIVKSILQELNSHHHYVGDYIIGHESHLEELLRVLDLKSDDVRVIGIHGMGGIGKTTLIKALFNKISSEFEACSFLSDVREASLQFKGIVPLQQQLLKDIFHSDQTFTDESKGTQLIKNKIGMKKVLIILDDVDSQDQLEALVDRRDWFRVGSRIIITTRDTKPLTEHGVKDDELYELPVLNHDDSKKLFCYHAFGNENPSISNEYAKMCDEAVSFIKGLPLALKVFGSQFFDLKTEKEWRGLLTRLKESRNKKIFERLKLSYDSLDDNEKQVFLDVACCFVGKRRMGKNFEVDDVKHFWEECDFYPDYAVNVLKHKSLIKINKWEEDECSLEAEVGRWCFEMHDQIRDMGRKIVEDEGKACSRMWNNLKVIKTLRKLRVPTSTSIEGIMFKGEKKSSDFSAPSLQEMDRLRLFYVQDAKFEGFPHLPEDLKWLGLPNCEHFPTLPSVSIPKEVTVLDLHHNEAVANVLLENCNSRSMVFDKLKVLDLSSTRITMTPNFSMMPCLAKVTFKGCMYLVEVHESVGQLMSLVWLNLSGCEKLEKLPETICQLTSLEFLSLFHCWKLLYLPKQLGNMTSLKHLDLRTWSPHIRSLPASMRKLHVLEHLFTDDDIRGISTPKVSEDLVAASKLICRSAYILDVLPDPCCRKKIQLELIDDTVEELRETFIRWENLELLILNCRSLKSLPVGIGQLPKLKVLEVYSDNHVLVDGALPLASIEKLVLKCANLEYFSSSNKKAQNLKHLTLESKKVDVLPDWIGSSGKLETLELRGCYIMESKVPADHFNTSRIPFAFENLKILSLDGGPMKITLSFSFLHCLEKLMLMNCKELIEVHESIGSLKKLQFLKISGCTMLERLPDNICELHSLISLDLKGCVNLSSLPEQLVNHMEMLEELCLDKTGIRSLPATSMGKFARLKHLSIRDCQSLNSIPESFVSCLESLRELHIQGNPLKGMPTDNFSISTNYGTLYASTPWEFMDALPKSYQELVSRLKFTNERIERLTDSIGRFKNVTSMVLRCNMLKALPNSMGQLKNLNDLYLTCNTVALFDWIYLPGSLKRLKVECIEFEPQPSLSTILGNSTANGCKNVKEDLPIIGQLGSLSQDQSNKSTVILEKLKTLELSAKQITVTPDFSFAPCLERLTLKNCEKLTEVHESVGTLVNLKSLKIRGCNALEGLPDAICRLTSLKCLELSQYADWSGDNSGLRDTRIKSILSSLEQLTKLEKVCISKELGGTNVRKIDFAWSTLRISSLCLEWVTALWSSVLHSVSTLVITDDQIEALPNSIVQMQDLVHLKFECGSLKHLPDIGGQMKRLKGLNLSGSGIIELPPWLGCLTNLMHLNLSTTRQNYDFLSELSHLTSLQELDLSGRNFGSSLPCISNFSRLRVLKVSGCEQLHSIPHLSSSVLRKLDASNCTNLRGLPDFSNLQSLEYLYLRGCNSLEWIPGFKTIAENIERLELPGPSGACSNLSDDFTNNVFMGALFRNLDTFRVGGNIVPGSHSSGQQCLSFLFPDVRFNGSKWWQSLTLALDGMVSSPVHMAVIMEDGCVFETTLNKKDDEIQGRFHFTEDHEIMEHLQKGSGKILVSTDVSKLSRVELEACFE